MDTPLTTHDYGILDCTPVGACILGPDFEVVLWNRILQQWSGITSDEIIGTDLRDHYGRLSEPRFESRISAILAGGPPAIFSTRLHDYVLPLPVAGELRRHTVTATAVPLPHSQTGVLLVFQDLSEAQRLSDDYRQMRDKTQLLLSREKERTALLQREIEERAMAEQERDKFFDLSVDLLCIIDKNGYLKRVNPQFVSVVGHSPTALQSRPFYGFIHPLDRESTRRALHGLSRGTTIVNLENRFLCSDGSYRHLSWTAPASTDSQLMYCAARDITDMRLAELSLRESEHRFRLLADTAPVLIWMSGVDKQCTYFSRPWLEFTGRALTQELGDGWTEGVYPEDLERCLDTYVSHFDRREPFMMEYRLRRHDGQYRWVLDRGIPRFSDSDRFEGYIGCCVDIHDRKQAENDLAVAKEQAEAANRTKSQFLANMSHEIRTPMTAILGFAELLTECAMSVEQKDAVHTIKDNGQHLLALINDILDLAKVESGQIDIERLPCNPHHIVADVINLNMLRASEKGLSLKIEYDTPIPENILSDPTRLRQSLLNLVSNAIKFTEQGQVVIRCAMHESELSQLLTFTVVDTGIGIPENRLEHVFAPFTQVNASTTRTHGGTGLGLPISKRLAELMGGTLTATSTEHHGSAFALTIDPGCCTSEPMVSHPPALGTSAGAPTTVNDTRLDGCDVLLVEDGIDNQRLITHILKKAGASVEICDNGQAGMQRALASLQEDRDFDVVLMDMQMPVMDGYAATAELRRQGYNKPIIALTANAMSGDREKCLDIGCDDFHSKPIDRARLIQCIAELWHPSARSGARQEPASIATASQLLSELPHQLATLESLLHSQDTKAIQHTMDDIIPLLGHPDLDVLGKKAWSVRSNCTQAEDLGQLQEQVQELVSLCKLVLFAPASPQSPHPQAVD